MDKNNKSDIKYSPELKEFITKFKKRHPLTPSEKEKLKALGRFIQERMKEYKKAYPLGFDCYELFSDKNPLYMYKLRKATKKLINRYYKVRIKFYNNKDYRLVDALGDLPDKPGNLPYGMGDLPDDFFRANLTKYTNKEKMLKMNMPEFIENLNKVPEYTWNSLRYYIKKSKNSDSFEEEFLHILSDSLSIDFVLIDRLDTAFKKLSEEQREAIELIYHKGYSETEAAMHLGIKKQSVSERHERALEKLKKILSE